MPSLSANGVSIHYVERGSGEQTIVFAHSFLVDHRQFEPQMAVLEKHYRIIAYDHRDHGKSSGASNQYTIDDLVQDAVAVIEHTQAKPCHFVGLSTGGFVGIRLLIRHPELLRSMVLMDTSAQSEPLLKRIKYKAMLAALAMVGVRPLMRSVMALMFGQTSLKDPSKAAMLREWRERIAAGNPAAIARFGRAIWSREDLLGMLHTVETPTLVVVGAEDRALPRALALRIANEIPGAQMEVVPLAGHLCTLERPDAVNTLLTSFIRSH
jgi:pimeloyl-ACP methyl ester carboxylesterase